MEEPTREMEKETGAETELPETEPAAEQEEAKKAAEAKEAEAAEETAEDGKERKFFKKKKDKKDEKIEELTDRLTRQMAEFDNYRKRTLREKSELLKNGGESALTHLLPVVDDFERALQNIRSAEDIKAVTEGVELIYSKFMSYLSHQNVKPIETVGEPFDAETSEAVAMIPAPEPDMKGKVEDYVQTGYTLNDKVIRHAKVVVGE